MGFKEHFCLKDRDNFFVNVKMSPEDARLFFGKSELGTQIQDRLRKSLYLGEVPKMLLWGPYGGGKTHTLYHIKYFMASDTELKDKYAVHILELELRSKTVFQYLHEKMLERVGIDQVVDLFKRLLDENAGKDLNERLMAFFQDANLVQAVKYVGVGSKDALVVWKWLCGKQLKDSELSAIGLSRNITEVSDQVRVLSLIGKLSAKYGQRLLFLIDEAEAFNNLQPEPLETFHDGFRKLAELENQYVGFIVAFFANGPDDMPKVLDRDDIMTRLRQNIQEIKSLSTVDDVKAFVKDLVHAFIDQQAAQERLTSLGYAAEDIPSLLDTYPFTADGLDSLAEYAASTDVHALPRNIINAVSEAAVDAFFRKCDLVDYKSVENVVHQAFSS